MVDSKNRGVILRLHVWDNVGMLPYCGNTVLFYFHPSHPSTPRPPPPSPSIVDAGCGNCGGICQLEMAWLSTGHYYVNYGPLYSNPSMPAAAVGLE